MVVKKRSSPLSFESKDQTCVLPLTQNIGGSDLSQKRPHRPQHEDDEAIVMDHMASWWRGKAGTQWNKEPILPMYSSHDNPQSDEISPIYQRRTIVFTAKKRKSSLHTILWLAFVVSGLVMYSSVRTELRVYTEELIDTFGSRGGLEVGITSNEFDTRGLEREVFKLENVHWRRLDEVAELHARETANSLTGQSSAEKELFDMQRTVEQEDKKSNSLRQHVQRIARKHVISKYGPGPHRVEFTVDFGEGDINTFIAEMAPVDLMPYSVQSFLDMVDAKLWDSTSFLAKEPSLIKAAPVTYEKGTSDVDKLSEFIVHGLQHLAFSETSLEYTHKKYTLGFTAGNTPSWFINTVDNTVDRKEQPCFATIVDGFDTIRKIEKSPTYSGIWLSERIGIKQARLL